ncbi:hypothetical protein BDW72DRAFT_203839 [Aspergillus terricola var. indicus]
MPLSEFKLRDVWCESSAGREIPDFVIEGGQGGRFDSTLAQQYAFKCSTLSKTASLRKEGPRLLAQVKATRSVPEGERVRYNKFLVTTLRTVESVIERSRRRIVAYSEGREVFSRYAAFLNFVEVQSGRRFSLLGLSPNTSAVYCSPPPFSLATRSEEEKEKERDKHKGRSGSVAGMISGLTADRHALYQAKYQQYREEVGLNDDESEPEPEQGSLEAEMDKFLEELSQEGNTQDLEKSSWR